MSNRNDASQGMVQDPAQPRGHRVASPDTTAIFNRIQSGVNAADRAATKPRPPQEISNRQDWRKG